MEGYVDLSVGQEILSLNVDDSNAIILPGKKHGTKKMNKVCEIQRKRRNAEHSKSQKRKLQKLQVDKEKELLLLKSIETLEKYKIGDVAQSLMWTSKNLGQVETFQAKRRREVQLSKAGLRLPTNNQPIKRKNNDNTSKFESQSKRLHLKENCDVSSFKDPLIGGREFMQVDSSIRGRGVGDVGRCETPVQFKETSFENCEIPVPLNQQKVLPISVFTVPKVDKTVDRIHEYQAGYLSGISNLANGHPGGARSAPIAVHVSRPPEIENSRKDLPIVMMEQEIMEAINENKSVIICGETGCGKTTQVPQFLYEAGFGSSRSFVKSGMIGVTQPCRVAVLATAKRVAFELGLRLGTEVGFQVRHEKRIGVNCSIKFMTDGILLRELQNDFLLKRYSVIILDEAHERSVNTDILIGMLSRIIHLRQRIYEEQKNREILLKNRMSPENKVYPLKLVLMSATLRIEDFVSRGRIFSEPPPVIEVPARQYPVDIHFSKRTEIVDYVGQAYKKVLLIHKNLPPGGILVFVTGQREVEYLCQKLRKASRKMVTNRSRRTGNAPSLLERNCAEDHKINEISEAFEIEGDLSQQQTDRFSSYDDDYDDMPEDESDSSYDSDEDSDLEVSCKDVFGPNNMGSDNFFREDGNSTSLKAAFDALAGKNTLKLTDGKQSAPGTAKGPDHCNLSSGENTVESDVPSVSPMCVLPLYAMLPASAQLRVFNKVKDGERLVVVATNVAETSLTIPGTKYVVDTGREKVKMHDSANGMETYNVQWISKASAAQRAGRAGRTGPGHCYRLYSSAVFSNIFSDFSDAEISKIPVDGVILLMKSMGIDKVANFPFPTAPESGAIKKAEECLKVLEALDTDGRLTSLGKAMAHYPMSPRHSRMLLTVIQILRKGKGYSRPNLVLGYAIAAAAALSLSNPFITQFEGNHDENSGTAASEKVLDKEEKLRKKKQKEASRASRAKFCNPTSDALSIAYALQCFELSNSPINFCTEYALHPKTMEEMSKLRKQLLKLVFQQSLRDSQQDVSWNHGKMVDVESSWRDLSNKQHLSSDEEELLGQAICAGWADRVAKKTKAYSDLSDGDKKVISVRYQTLVGETVFLHRRSSVSRSAPEYLVYSELLHTKRPYIYGATTVKPDWLVRYSSSLCTFSAPHTDPRPYYEPRSDQVFCWITPTFGPYHWQLPLHRFPIKDDMQRVAVFASSLIGGAALPCLKSAQEFLAAAPAIILKPGSSGQKQVRNLLLKLNTRTKTIDSCAMLREVWSENPGELYPEILDWFEERFHNQFEKLWAEMHREVLLDPQERFAKKGKKERSGKKDKSRKKYLVI